MPFPEVEATAEGNGPALNKLVASIIVQATKYGDHSRMNALLDRIVGKATDKLELTLPEPFIVRRLTGEEVVMGAKKPDEEAS